jgi:hypothetical protein
MWERVKPCVLYNGAKLEIVEEFKYLGVMFHATQRCSAARQYRLQQGKRLVAAWLRTCDFWLFRPDMVINQFKTCVLPAMEYGVCLWGAGAYQTHAWEQVEIFWRYIARTILGMPLRTPTAAVYGELGWSPFWVRAAWQATAFWTRVTCMPDDSLTRQAMHVQRSLVLSNKPCWLRMMKDTLCMTRVGLDYWTKWLATDNFRCICQYKAPCIHDPERSVMRGWEDDCLDAFNDFAITEWKADILRTQAKRGSAFGGNKLRTYARFKHEWRLEPYLVYIRDRDQRVVAMYLKRS